MTDLADKAVREYRMLSPGDTVLAAVSGGADSVALLHFLWSRRDEYGITLKAAHVDHGLRGDESRRDRLFVEEFCAGLGVPCSVLEADIGAQARKAGESVEECGRRVRYAYFKSLKADRTATAHTADDSAETVLLALARGTGLRGLCGIPPVRGDIVRPLITCTRADVEAYIREHALEYRTDSTNADTAYRRNFVRRELIPRFRALNPSFSKTAAGAALRLSRDADHLDALAGECLRRARRDGGFDADAVLRQALPIQSRALRFLCAEENIPCGAAHVRLMTAALENGSSCTLPGGRVFGVSGGLCGFFDRGKAGGFCLPLAPGAHKIPGGILHIEEKTFDFKESGKKINNLLFKNELDCGMIGDNPVIRTRRPGDRLSMPSRGVSKSLKKLFIEEKVPRWQRDRLPVVADDAGVLWVYGFGADQRALPGGRTEKILSVGFAADTGPDIDNFEGTAADGNGYRENSAE